MYILYYFLFDWHELLSNAISHLLKKIKRVGIALRRHLFDPSTALRTGFALDPGLQFRFCDFQIIAQLQVQPGLASVPK